MGCCGGFIGSLWDSAVDATEDVGGAIVGGLEDVGGAIVGGVEDVGETIVNTIEQVADNPALLAAVAINIVAPGAGTAIGQAIGLSGTAATIVGNAAINTALNGGDVEAGIISAALPIVGGEIAGAAASQFSDLGLSDSLANTAGKITSQAALSAVTGKGDPLSILVSGGLSAGVDAITNEIPGYADLPQVAKQSIKSAVTASLSDRDPTQAAVDAAVSSGLSALSKYIGAADSVSLGPIPELEPEFAPTPEPTPEPIPESAPEPAPDVIKQLEDAGLTEDYPVDQEPTTPVFQGPMGPMTGDQIKRYNDEFAKYLDFLQAGQPLPPDYGVQDLGITDENWDSFNRNLSTMLEEGRLPSQWQGDAEGNYTFVSDDGSTLTIGPEGQIVHYTEAPEGNLPGEIPTPAPAPAPAPAPSPRPAPAPAPVRSPFPFQQLVASTATAAAPTVSIPQLANVFYYGKDFGSPRQKLTKKGTIAPETYDPLSVTQPGAESDELLAMLGGAIAGRDKSKDNEENDLVEAASGGYLNLLLQQAGNPMTEEELLEFLRKG